MRKDILGLSVLMISTFLFAVTPTLDCSTNSETGIWGSAVGTATDGNGWGLTLATSTTRRTMKSFFCN